MTLLEVILLVVVIVAIPLCTCIGFILGRRDQMAEVSKFLDLLADPPESDPDWE